MCRTYYESSRNLYLWSSGDRGEGRPHQRRRNGALLRRLWDKSSLSASLLSILQGPALTGSVRGYKGELPTQTQEKLRAQQGQEDEHTDSEGFQFYKYLVSDSGGADSGNSVFLPEAQQKVKAF